MFSSKTGFRFFFAAICVAFIGAALILTGCPKLGGSGTTAGDGESAADAPAGGDGQTGGSVSSGGTGSSGGETPGGETVDKGISDMFPDETAPEEPGAYSGGKWKPLKLTSSAFQDKGAISPRYSRKGNNLSPPLKIDGVPDHAKSLVIIMDDPDAPGGLWTHWVLFNIPPATAAIGENEAVAGARHGLNSWGQDKYDGPQPPSGTHRYQFKLYALDNTLGLDAGATRSQVEQAMTGHVIATAVLSGTFGAG